MGKARKSAVPRTFYKRETIRVSRFVLAGATDEFRALGRGQKTTLVYSFVRPTGFQFASIYQLFYDDTLFSRVEHLG